MAKDLISIEKVLNSRCSSGSGPNNAHFGTFIKKDPPEPTMDSIIDCLNVPRFSDGKLLYWFENEYLFLGFEIPRDPCAERLLHIENGMQHEAVYLACAAEGVGTCIQNQGINGTECGEKKVTAGHVIMEIADPYNSGKFTTDAPGPEKLFISGKNLTDPCRHGDTECLPHLSKLKTSSKTGSSATERDISQLLWAGRGRTPHCVKTNRWKYMRGLTIPTWGAIQNLTSVYLVTKKKLYSYVNWTKEFSLVNRALREKFGWTRGNPTHELLFIREADFSTQLDGTGSAIIMCQNEKSGRALWEVGYMLENIFLQARSLGIFYETKLFEAEEISALAKLGTADAVAGVLL